MCSLTCALPQVQKEKHIQGLHEKQNRELERRGSRRGHKWPGGPACGTEAAAAPRAPYFEDGDIWRSELLKRQVRCQCMLTRFPKQLLLLLGAVTDSLFSCVLQPLKADPAGNHQGSGHGQLTRMGTRYVLCVVEASSSFVENMPEVILLESGVD